MIETNALSLSQTARIALEISLSGRRYVCEIRTVDWNAVGLYNPTRGRRIIVDRQLIGLRY